jgi:hypothetical protein
MTIFLDFRSGSFSSLSRAKCRKYMELTSRWGQGIRVADFVGDVEFRNLYRKHLMLLGP